MHTFQSDKWHLVHADRKPLGFGGGVAVAWCGAWFHPKHQDVNAPMCVNCREAVWRTTGRTYDETLKAATKATLEANADKVTIRFEPTHDEVITLGRDNFWPSDEYGYEAITIPRKKVIKVIHEIQVMQDDS